MFSRSAAQRQPALEVRSAESRRDLSGPVEVRTDRSRAPIVGSSRPLRPNERQCSEAFGEIMDAGTSRTASRNAKTRTRWRSTRVLAYAGESSKDELCPDKPRLIVI